MVPPFDSEGVPKDALDKLLHSVKIQRKFHALK
jgi:hypothetical protein